MDIPTQLLYTAEHEWVKVEGNIASVGITDHAQQALGDMVGTSRESISTDSTKRASRE